MLSVVRQCLTYNTFRYTQIISINLTLSYESSKPNIIHNRACRLYRLNSLNDRQRINNPVIFKRLKINNDNKKEHLFTS